MNVARSRRKNDEHEKLARRPEPLDEQLTNQSVTQGIKNLLLKNGTNQLSQGQIRKRTQQGMQKRMAIEQRKSEERKDAIHTLYMHARSFVTTEAQLDAAIEKAFGTVEEPARKKLIWEEEGSPKTTQDMLSQEGVVQKTQRRIKRIAEELTGGKIEERKEERSTDDGYLPRY